MTRDFGQRLIKDLRQGKGGATADHVREYVIERVQAALNDKPRRRKSDLPAAVRRILTAVEKETGQKADDILGKARSEEIMAAKRLFIQRMRADGYGPTRTAAVTGYPRSTVYYHLGEEE